MAAAALLALGQASIGSAQAATTVTIAPSAPSSSNAYPFGRGNLWPQQLWFYKNIPAFNLRSGDTLAFDLQAMNNINVQLQISMAPTTVNGGDVPAEAFTTIVPNTQVPANPLGNTINGDYELAFTATAPFNFLGGGLVMRLSNPGGAFATDNTPTAVFVNSLATGADPSGFFVKRIIAEPDGVHPWGGMSEADYIAGFRLILQDPPAPPTTTPATAPKKKKCKKKRKRKGKAGAAKKCKKKRKK